MTNQSTTFDDHDPLANNILHVLEDFIDEIGTRECTAHFETVVDGKHFLKGQNLIQNQSDSLRIISCSRCSNRHSGTRCAHNQSNTHHDGRDAVAFPTSPLPRSQSRKRCNTTSGFSEK